MSESEQELNRLYGLKRQMEDQVKFLKEEEGIEHPQTEKLLNHINKLIKVEFTKSEPPKVH